MLKPEDVTVILCSPQGQANVGAVARSMACFGPQELLLVNPGAPPDVTARNWSCHGAPLLETARTFKSLPEALQDINLAVGFTRRAGRKRHKMMSLEELAQELHHKDDPGKVALVFGTEDSGMSNEELDACHRLVTIPSLGSLNLAHSVSLGLYELFGRSLPLPPASTRASIVKAETPASPELKRAMLGAIADHLNYMGYPFHKGSLADEMKKLSNILDRVELESWEINFLGGLFKQLRNKYAIMRGDLQPKSRKGHPLPEKEPPVSKSEHP